MFMLYVIYNFFFLSFRQIVYNTEAHIRVVELLLLKGKWGEHMPVFDSAPGIILFY